MALSREFIQEKFKTPFVIGVSGVATAGKDTFFLALEKYLTANGVKIKRFAFADALKNEIDPFMKSSYGISAWTTDPVEKKMIRPMLVAHGGIRRSQSRGTHWTNIVTPAVKEAIANGIVPVITDVRYAEYECDEVNWLNNLGGKLVYVSRYTVQSGMRVFVQPPNADEARNDPLLRTAAFFSIEAPTFASDPVDSATIFVEQFIEKL